MLPSQDLSSIAYIKDLHKSFLANKGNNITNSCFYISGII